jgi:glycosyltransferase involved in cell wall biosynthesis
VNGNCFVYLTSFNHASFIPQAINSVLTQTYSDFSLTIWDDNSSDESLGIINEINDPRVQKFRNDVTKRAIVGINKSISELAPNDLIAIHHSDDVWEPTKLEKQVAFLEANPDIGAVFTLVQPIMEDGNNLADPAHFYSNVFDQPNRTQAEWLRYFFIHGNALCHPSILIRKKCYDEVGLYRFGFAQVGDLDMWIRLCMKFPIHIIQEKLIKFRVLDNEKNTSGIRLDTQIRDSYEKLLILENYRKIKDFEFFKQIFPEVLEFCNESNFLTDYALARICIDKKCYYAYSLFGQNLLFQLISNPESAKYLKEHFNFNYQDFIKITGENDIFSIQKQFQLKKLILEHKELENSYKIAISKILGLNEVIAEREFKIRNEQKLNAEKEELISQLKNSFFWKITKPLRYILNVYLPSSKS